MTCWGKKLPGIASVRVGNLKLGFVYTTKFCRQNKIAKECSHLLPLLTDHVHIVGTINSVSNVSHSAVLWKSGADCCTSWEDSLWVLPQRLGVASRVALWALHAEECQSSAAVSPLPLPATATACLCVPSAGQNRRIPMICSVFPTGSSTLPTTLKVKRRMLAGQQRSKHWAERSGQALWDTGGRQFCRQNKQQFLHRLFVDSKGRGKEKPLS